MKGWTRIARLLQEGGLYALLLLLPFSKAACEIAFGLLLLGWGIERLHPETRTHTVWRSPRLRPLALAIGAYLLVCACSILVSGFPWSSLRGFVGKWLEYLLFLVIVADVAVGPKVAVRCLVMLAVSALSVALHGVWQESYVHKVFSVAPAFSYGRMTGPYENPIDLATYFMVVIPLFMAGWMTVRGWKRFALSLLLLLLVGCVIRTSALGAWLGLGAGLLVMMALNRQLRWFGALALAALIAGAGIWSPRDGSARSLWAPMQDIGVIDRLDMWKAAMGMIQDRPVLGHGVNTFMANYMDYWVGGERTPRYAHNCYLQVAAETGLIGLAAFVWLLWCLFRRLRGGTTPLRSEESLLLCGLTAGLAAFAIQAGVDTNFYSLRQAALFWTLAGLAVGVSERHVAAIPAASRGET